MQPIRLREVILTLLAAGGAFVLGSTTDPITSVDSTTVRATTVQTATQRVGGSNGATMDGLFRATSVIDAASIGPGLTSSSAAIAVTGAGVNDHCNVDLVGNETGATSSMRLSCTVTAADAATIYFYNSSGTAIDLTSAVYSLLVHSF